MSDNSAWRFERNCDDCGGPMWWDRLPHGRNAPRAICPYCMSRRAEAAEAALVEEKARMRALIEAVDGNGMTDGVCMGPCDMAPEPGECAPCTWCEFKHAALEPPAPEPIKPGRYLLGSDDPAACCRPEVKPEPCEACGGSGRWSTDFGTYTCPSCLGHGTGEKPKDEE